MIDVTGELAGVRERLQMVLSSMDGALTGEEVGSGHRWILHDTIYQIRRIEAALDDPQDEQPDTDVADLNIIFKLHQIKEARDEGSAAPSPGTLSALIAHLLVMRDTHGSSIRVLYGAGEPVGSVEYVPGFQDPASDLPEDYTPAYINIG